MTINILKTPIITSIFLLIFSTPLIAQTNLFFATEEIHTHALFVPTDDQIQQAKKAEESRPAAVDPEGHWGGIVEGFQLSIRFSKDTFTNSEPIIASILLRNVSDKPNKYFVFLPKDNEMKFNVFMGNKQLQKNDEITDQMTFQEKLRHVNNGSRSMPVLPVGVQRRFTVKLNDSYNLSSNGQYTIQVGRSVPYTKQKGETNVISGFASFNIK